jgi:hypothetical protein
VVGFAVFFFDKGGGVVEVPVFFELFEEGVDDAGAYVFFDALFVLVYDLIAVNGALVEYGKYVEVVKSVDYFVWAVTIFAGHTAQWYYEIGDINV